MVKAETYATMAVMSRFKTSDFSALNEEGPSMWIAVPVGLRSGPSTVTPFVSIADMIPGVKPLKKAN